MIALPPPFRLARAEDGPVLAVLINAAGGGLPLHIWTERAEPGEDPWALGARRCAVRAEAGEAVVIDEGADGGAGVTAALIGKPIGPAPEVSGPDTPPLFAPLIDLEALAAESWYVNALAALPGHRGRGLGSRLLEVAARIARAEGLGRLSLIVSDANPDARRLYDRCGFAEVARRPMGPGWAGPGRDWVLMIRNLTD